MNCIAGDAFTNPSNPLALRAVVASSDHSPRKIQEEAALHQHRHPSETTGTEHYRRIRNPDSSQIPGLYLHQNGSKVPMQSHRVMDTSTFRQNIRETRSRPPENHSYHPGAQNPDGIMHRMDHTEARYHGEQSMDRQHRPPSPPFAGRAPTHSQYSRGMHGAPAETHPGHSHLQYSHGNNMMRPPAEAHDRFLMQQREQERFPMQQREQERLASLPVEEFDVFFPNGVPNEQPPLGVDYSPHGINNYGYEVQEQQYPNDFDLLSHAAPPAHHPQFGDPRVSHTDTDWVLNPASLQSGHSGYAQEEFRDMGFGNNAVKSHTGHSQPPMGLDERFAARVGVHLTPRDQHVPPLNPQPFYEPKSFEPRKRKPADVFLERRQSVGYTGQNNADIRQGQQVDPFAEEFHAFPQDSIQSRPAAGVDHGRRGPHPGHCGPNPVSDGDIDRFRTHGAAAGQVEHRSPGIARFQQMGTSQKSGETSGTETIAMFPTWKGPNENLQQNPRPEFDTRLQKESNGENTNWPDPPLVQPLGNNTRLLNSAQPAEGALRRPQGSASVPFPAKAVQGTSKPTLVNMMIDQQNLRPLSPRLQTAENMLRNNDQLVDRQPLISKPAKEDMLDFGDPLDSGDEPHHFPAALHPTYDTPSYLRFFNESIEVTLKGDRSRRPSSPIGAAADHATQESDTLEDIAFEGKTSIWGAFVRQKKQA